MSDKTALTGTCTSRFWCKPDEWGEILKTSDEAGHFLLPPAFSFGMPGRWKLLEIETQAGEWVRVTAQTAVEIVDNGEDLPPREVLEQISWVHVGTGSGPPE